jgi:hypothetical protein
MSSDEYFMMIEDFSLILDYLKAARMYLEDNNINEAMKMIEEAIFVVSKWV